MDTESQIYEEERQRRLKESTGVKIVIEINKQGNMSLHWSINGQEQEVHIPLRGLISAWYWEARKELPDLSPFDFDKSWRPTDEEIHKLINQIHEAPYYDNP